MREYYEQVHANKLGNSEENDKFLGITTCQEWIIKTENLISLTMSKVIESVIKISLHKKSSGLGDFYQIFKQEIMPVLLKMFWKFEEEGNPQTYFTRPV